MVKIAIHNKKAIIGSYWTYRTLKLKIKPWKIHIENETPEKNEGGDFPDQNKTIRGEDKPIAVEETW